VDLLQQLELFLASRLCKCWLMVQLNWKHRTTTYFCYSQATLQMPSELQARLAHTINTAIDSRINPPTLAVHNEVVALSAAQENSFQLIEGTIRSVGKNTEVEYQKHNQKIALELENKFNTLSISNKSCAKGIGKIKEKTRITFEAVQDHSIESRTASLNIQQRISDLSSCQSQSNDIILRRVLQTGRETVHAIQRQASISGEQISGLHQKLDHMNWLMVSVKGRMGDLSIAEGSSTLSTSNSEIEKAIGNIKRSIWLLVSALYILISELM
jgi:hypothetical protein